MYACTCCSTTQGSAAGRTLLAAVHSGPRAPIGAAITWGIPAPGSVAPSKYRYHKCIQLCGLKMAVFTVTHTPLVQCQQQHAARNCAQQATRSTGGYVQGPTRWCPRHAAQQRERNPGRAVPPGHLPVEMRRVKHGCAPAACTVLLHYMCHRQPHSWSNAHCKCMPPNQKHHPGCCWSTVTLTYCSPRGSCTCLGQHGWAQGHPHDAPTGAAATQQLNRLTPITTFSNVSGICPWAPPAREQPAYPTACSNQYQMPSGMEWSSQYTISSSGRLQCLARHLGLEGGAEERHGQELVSGGSLLRVHVEAGLQHSQRLWGRARRQLAQLLLQGLRSRLLAAACARPQGLQVLVQLLRVVKLVKQRPVRH